MTICSIGNSKIYGLYRYLIFSDLLKISKAEAIGYSIILWDIISWLFAILVIVKRVIKFCNTIH